MRIVDLIELKREGGRLPQKEIVNLFDAYLANQVKPYQISALLMAIYFKGMVEEELIEWTEAMMSSGDVMNFSHLDGVKVDKHSTGGVGDKISLPLAPLLGACDLYVPMISGRGLGHTGGTLDKLESIQGFNTRFDGEGFERLLLQNRVGLIGQTERLVPIDRRLYALRDVTATVPSIPLIASSIMSKKLAEGTEHLVLDVKVGAGAFMKTLDEARTLAETCIRLGHGMGRNVRALLTQMDQPIGVMIGNALEVRESVEVLRGGGPADTRALTLALVEELLEMAGRDPNIAKERLDSGAAYDLFCEIVKAQGGDVEMVRDLSKLPTAPQKTAVRAPRSGVVQGLNARDFGDASALLGAGRMTAEDEIDPRVGIELNVKVGDTIQEGDPIAWLWHDTKGLESAQEKVLAACQIGDEPTAKLPLMIERVSMTGASPYTSTLSAR